MQYLELKNISKSYGEKILFKNINLTISKGDKIALIAKNGSGKSTMLRVIAGEDMPEGENARMTMSKQINLGYLCQEPIIAPQRKIIDVVLETKNEKILSIKNYEDDHSITNILMGIFER